MFNRLNSYILFAKQGIKDRNVASLVPTLPRNVTKVCENIPKDEPLIIMEYGPGTGPFTEYFVNNLHKDSRIIVIDLNKDFIEYLKNRFENNKDQSVKVEVVYGDAQDAKKILQDKGIYQIDYCFSGIPLSFFPLEQREMLIKKTKDLLKPGGEFIVYQVTTVAAKSMKKIFGNNILKTYLLNIPILFVMRSVKN